MPQKKTSNLKIVQQQTLTEAEQAKYEQQKAEKRRKELEESWKLTRTEIAGRAHALRLQLEVFRSQLEGLTFDIVNSQIPPSAETPSNRPDAIDLVDDFDSYIKGTADEMREKEHDELFNLRMDTADTAFQIGILAGAIFSGASDREIDRLERGLIHATVSRGRCKDRG
jgi:hypothetical protein